MSLTAIMSITANMSTTAILKIDSFILGTEGVKARSRLVLDISPFPFLLFGQKKERMENG
jgi:hypothetical protein